MTLGSLLRRSPTSAFSEAASVAPRHQDGVLGGDDRDPLDPDHGGRELLGHDDAVLGIPHQRRTGDDIAVRVLRRQGPDRVPAADVGPAEITRQHGGAFRPFHDRVIDRLRRRAPERPLVEHDEIEVADRVRDGGSRRLDGLRIDVGIFAQQRRRAEQEIARVPEIAVGEIAFGRAPIRLLDEGVEGAQGAAVEERARLDIAVARLRPVGGHAEGDDRPRRPLPRRWRSGRRGGRIADRGPPRAPDDGVGPGALDGEVSPCRDGRPGIPPDGLENDIRRDADLLRLLGDEEAVIAVREDDRPLEQGRICLPDARCRSGLFRRTAPYHQEKAGTNACHQGRIHARAQIRQTHRQTQAS